MVDLVLGTTLVVVELGIVCCFSVLCRGNVHVILLTGGLVLEAEACVVCGAACVEAGVVDTDADVEVTTGGVDPIVVVGEEDEGITVVAAFGGGGLARGFQISGPY